MQQGLGDECFKKAFEFEVVGKDRSCLDNHHSQCRNNMLFDVLHKGLPVANSAPTPAPAIITREPGSKDRAACIAPWHWWWSRRRPI
jgi:hypothetical protein